MSGFHAPARTAIAAAALASVLVFSLGGRVLAQSKTLPNSLEVEPNGTVHVPAQNVPVSKFLSPEGKAYLAEHLLNVRKPQQISQANGIPPLIAGYLTRQRVLYAADRTETRIGGVHAYVYTPKGGVSSRNRNRVLIDLHGGGFTGCWPGCAELESIPIAALGKIRVVSLDYREQPQYRFPAASEDVASAYTELLKTYHASAIGIYGCSAGGMLTGESVAWILAHKLPKPGAIAILCAGLTSPNEGFGGDADYEATPIGEARMAGPPDALPKRPRGAQGLGYFAGTSPTDPLAAPAESPALLAQFPPSLIVTATRGFELSSAVVTHARLVKAGAQSDLHVWEGMFHGFFYNADVPESKDCFDVIVKFFDSRLE
ncbi:MAG TPA: alpha/beta hydrolase fold domain-containing protein [Steroidobacteraceae bacterium]